MKRHAHHAVQVDFVDHIDYSKTVMDLCKNY